MSVPGVGLLIAEKGVAAADHNQGLPAQADSRDKGEVRPHHLQRAGRGDDLHVRGRDECESRISLINDLAGIAADDAGRKMDFLQPGPVQDLVDPF